MQRDILLASSICRQELAQWSQASAQVLQASMHEVNCSWGIDITPVGSWWPQRSRIRPPRLPGQHYRVGASAHLARVDIKRPRGIPCKRLNFDLTVQQGGSGFESHVEEHHKDLGQLNALMGTPKPLAECRTAFVGTYAS